MYCPDRIFWPTPSGYARLRLAETTDAREINVDTKMKSSIADGTTKIGADIIPILISIYDNDIGTTTAQHLVNPQSLEISSIGQMNIGLRLCIRPYGMSE